MTVSQPPDQSWKILRKYPVRPGSCPWVNKSLELGFLRKEEHSESRYSVSSCRRQFATKGRQYFQKKTVLLLSVLSTGYNKEVNTVNGTQNSGMSVCMGETHNSLWYVWLDKGLITWSIWIHIKWASGKRKRTRRGGSRKITWIKAINWVAHQNLTQELRYSEATMAFL